jgi:DNA-directed RNA polymerase subunit RPC12/RpoP
MSSEPIIVCRSCGSYRAARLPEPHTTRYHCACCGDEFEVNDPRAYVKKHPPNPRRCDECDKESVELVEQNHRESDQPKDEVTDLYRCSHCGQEILRFVRKSDSVFYD